MTGLFYGQQSYKKRGDEYFRILEKMVMNVFTKRGIEDSYFSDPYHNIVVAKHYPIKSLLIKNYEL